MCGEVKIIREFNKFYLQGPPSGVQNLNRGDEDSDPWPILHLDRLRREMFAAVLRAIFAIILGVLLVGDALICNMLLLTPEAILSKRTTEGLALVITHYVFAVAMLLCPWIQISSDGDLSATWREVLGHITSTSDNRPVFLIGNHTSFLDTVLCVAKTPFMLTWNARTYVSNGLLSMPLLGTVIKAMGLFTVQFKGVKDGDFSVDKEKMAKMSA